MEKHNFQVLVGAKLRLVRKNKGYSQMEASSLAGVSDTYWGSIERGVRNISLQSLEKLAAALGVNPWDLFCFEDIDTEVDIQEKIQVLEVHNAFLKGRTLGEVKMIHKVAKGIAETFDNELLLRK